MFFQDYPATGRKVLFVNRVCVYVYHLGAKGVIRVLEQAVLLCVLLISLSITPHKPAAILSFIRSLKARRNENQCIHGTHHVAELAYRGCTILLFSLTTRLMAMDSKEPCT